MTAKAYLGQARQAKLRVDAMLERRRRCLELAAYCGDAEMPELAALKGELEAQVEAWAALVRAAERRIDGLEDPLQRDVLKLRYLNGWSWKAIACRMCFSRDWLMRVHRRALGEMEEEGELGMRNEE